MHEICQPSPIYYIVSGNGGQLPPFLVMACQLEPDNIKIGRRKLVGETGIEPVTSTL